MTHIRIYTTSVCPYCVRAKRLLDKKGVPYEEINVEANPELRQKLVAMSGGRTTVPQIFFDDVSMGGCDDLYALEANGELDPLIEKMGFDPIKASG